VPDLEIFRKHVAIPVESPIALCIKTLLYHHARMFYYGISSLPEYCGRSGESDCGQTTKVE